MHILFYLPVVTPWWFDSIVAPMIRAAAKDAEVSVLVPPMWRNTGIGPEQLAACDDIAGVNWVILDGEDHPKLRHSGIDETDLIDFVRELAPDLTLCRSADIETPKLFPGVVRYIMEGAAAPFITDPAQVWLSHTLNDHALVPALDARQRGWLDAAIDPLWRAREQILARVDRTDYLDATGLPAGRRIIGLPLEYEHPEIFFAQHNVFPDNLALIAAIVPHLQGDMILAVTNHPLNERHCDNQPLSDAVAAYGDAVRLLPPIGGAPGLATALLARHSDGMIVGNSKSFALCGFSGTPMLRLSHFRTGGWMRAYGAIEPFMVDVAAGTAPAGTRADARLWFAFHLFNNAFDPADPTLDAATLYDLATQPVSEARWPVRLDQMTPNARIAA